jgi:hypothetical protein
VQALSTSVALRTDARSHAELLEDEELLETFDIYLDDEADIAPASIKRK